MRTVIAEPEDYPSEGLALLTDIGSVVQGPFAREDLLRAVDQTEALIVRFAHRIDEDLIRAAPRLRAIASASTGTDHIDIAACAARDISVISLKGETEFLRTIPSTAELTFGLILMLTRNVLGAALSTRNGDWNRNEFRGRNLHGRKLGLIGCGRIGEMVALYATAFGLQVSAFDPFRQHLPETVNRADNLLDLLVRSDIVSVHVPLDTHTTGLIGRPELSAMPKGSYLINTARGAIVDEEALCDALSSGHLAGAAVDVVAIEPREGDTLHGRLAGYARSNTNLILTPHIGGATFDSMERAETFVARKLVAYLRRIA